MDHIVQNLVSQKQDNWTRTTKYKIISRGSVMLVIKSADRAEMWMRSLGEATSDFSDGKIKI